MSHNSHQRSAYFNKNIKNQPTSGLYLEALAASPYRTHRRMAVALMPILTSLEKERDALENSNSVQTSGIDN